MSRLRPRPYRSNHDSPPEFRTERRATDYLNDLPNLFDWDGIPIFENKARSWRDDPIYVSHPSIDQYLNLKLKPYLIVGDANFFRMQIEAHNDVKRAVREHLGDVIDWLREAGVEV